MPCNDLAGAIQQAFTTTQDDTYTDVAYMDAITTEFTNRGFTLPDMITSVGDVFTHCDFTLTIIEGIGTDPDVAEITWGQDADRKRA